MENEKKTRFTVKMPQDIDVSLDNSVLTFKGPKGELKRNFKDYKVNISLNEKDIVLDGQKDNKPTRTVLMTTIAHIKNMINGVKFGWKYELQLSYSHFPMTVEKAEKEILIKNFIGEKFPRKAKIVGDTQVEIKGQDIVLKGLNLEEVSQTSGNLEKITKVIGKDIRRFTDGIYLTKYGVDNENGEKLEIEIIRG